MTVDLHRSWNGQHLSPAWLQPGVGTGVSLSRQVGVHPAGVEQLLTAVDRVIQQAVRPVAVPGRCRHEFNVHIIYPLNELTIFSQRFR